MALLALGINHQTAPVQLRERVAFSAEATPRALSELARQPGVAEAAILSTCNRTELYCTIAEGAETAPQQWLIAHHEIGANRLDEFIYRYRDADAVRHMFRVATGLESMVLGEPQVLGQMKEAYQFARDAQTLRTPMERLFQQTFAVAKRVRTDTRIGAHPVSIAFAAVRLAEQVFADLGSATVLLIGAGDTIELAARHLHESHVQRLIVANRTLENAQALATRFGGYAIALSELPQHLNEADIVISSTASREPIVTLAVVQRAIQARRRRPMFMVDLAVPRDIEPAVAALEDVYLYSVDDLQSVIEENLNSRREAAREAEAIIELQVEHYMAWWRAQDAQGPLLNLRRRGEKQRDAVLSKARHLLERGRSPEEVLNFLAETLTNKLLHAPSAALHDAARRGDAELLAAAERLFGQHAPSESDQEP